MLKSIIQSRGNIIRGSHNHLEAFNPRWSWLPYTNDDNLRWVHQRPAMRRRVEKSLSRIDVIYHLSNCPGFSTFDLIFSIKIPPVIFVSISNNNRGSCSVWLPRWEKGVTIEILSREHELKDGINQAGTINYHPLTWCMHIKTPCAHLATSAHRKKAILQRKQIQLKAPYRYSLRGYPWNTRSSYTKREVKTTEYLGSKACLLMEGRDKWSHSNHTFQWSIRLIYVIYEEVLAYRLYLSVIGNREPASGNRNNKQTWLGKRWFGPYGHSTFPHNIQCGKTSISLQSDQRVCLFPRFLWWRFMTPVGWTRFLIMNLYHTKENLSLRHTHIRWNRWII